MKVALYARCSTDHQNLDGQIDKLESYCKARGWTQTTLFKDLGVSGAKSSRPALNELMLAAKKRQIDCVVVTKMDRLGRSLKHLVDTLNDFQELGIKCVFIDDAIDFTTSAGRFMAHMLAAVAEFERELIKERVRAGVKRAQEKGVKFGPKVKVNPDTVKKLKSEGMSQNAIARKLRCSPGTVNRIIKASA